MTVHDLRSVFEDAATYLGTVERNTEMDEGRAAGSRSAWLERGSGPGLPVSQIPKAKIGSEARAAHAADSAGGIEFIVEFDRAIAEMVKAKASGCSTNGLLHRRLTGWRVRLRSIVLWPPDGLPRDLHRDVDSMRPRSAGAAAFAESTC
jgi:hypothetical protein